MKRIVTSPAADSDPHVPESALISSVRAFWPAPNSFCSLTTGSGSHDSLPPGLAHQATMHGVSPSGSEMKGCVLRARDSRPADLIWTEVSSFVRRLSRNLLHLRKSFRYTSRESHLIRLECVNICGAFGGKRVLLIIAQIPQLAACRSVKTWGGTPQRLCLELSHHQNEVSWFCSASVILCDDSNPRPRSTRTRTRSC